MTVLEAHKHLLSYTILKWLLGLHAALYAAKVMNDPHGLLTLYGWASFGLVLLAAISLLTKRLPLVYVYITHVLASWLAAVEAVHAGEPGSLLLCAGASVLWLRLAWTDRNIPSEHECARITEATR